jgi:hypothetical protein
MSVKLGMPAATASASARDISVVVSNSMFHLTRLFLRHFAKTSFRSAIAKARD